MALEVVPGAERLFPVLGAERSFAILATGEPSGGDVD